MIDIHTHVLYGIDDGSRNITESIEMCRDAYENGCDSLVLTPHFFDFNVLPAFIDERNKRVKSLIDSLLVEDIKLNIYSGAELYLSNKIFGADDLDDLTINHSRYLLCEMPLGPFRTDNVLLWFDELIDRGYTPILAHPERYVVLHQDYALIDAILDRPILMQVNIDSLRGRNGPEPQDMAIDFIENGYAQFIASDAHDPVYRHTRLSEKLEDITRFISKSDIHRCLVKNPQKVIDDIDIL